MPSYGTQSSLEPETTLFAPGTMMYPAPLHALQIAVFPIESLHLPANLGTPFKSHAKLTHSQNFKLVFQYRGRLHRLQVNPFVPTVLVELECSFITK
jgi:hypothetical protein